MSEASVWSPTALDRGTVRAIAWAGGVLYVALREGAAGADSVYASRDDGLSWTSASAGLPARTAVTALAASGAVLYAGTAGRGVYTTVDEGRIWAPAGTGLPDAPVLALAAGRNDLFAGLSDAGVLRCTARQRTQHGRWRATPALPVSVRSGTALLVYDGAVYVSHRLGIDRLRIAARRGAGWERADEGLPAGAVVQHLAAAEGVLYAATSTALLRSDDGRRWCVLSDPVAPGHYVRGLAAAAGWVLVGTYGPGHGGNGSAELFASGDGGMSWASLHDGLPAGTGAAPVVAAPTMNVFAGVEAHGLWRRTLPKRLPAAPGRPAFALDANVPNPFGGTTAIPFTLYASAHIRLAVYDMTGAEVAALLDGPLPAGPHRVAFDAPGLDAGFYEVRLEVGPVRQVRQMVLLR